MDFGEMIKNMGSYVYFLAAFIALGIVMMVVNLKKNSNRKNEYLKKYPNAVKVWAKRTNVVVAQSAVTIGMVDGETPAYFQGGTYVKPGKSELMVRFDASRVGVFYKQVNTYTDYVTIQVDLEEGKEYLLSFDKKKEEFVIEEKND